MITKQITVHCDNCGEWDQASMSATKLRKELKTKGWSIKPGSDLCPVCASGGFWVCDECGAKIPNSQDIHRCWRVGLEIHKP